MKKLVKILTFVLVLFMTTKKVYAAEKIVQGDYIPAYVNKSKVGTTRYMQMGFLKLSSSGSYVYCLEPFKELNFNAKYNRFVSSPAIRAGVSEEAWKKIESYGYYGYMYKDHTDPIWYAAAQVLIWRTVDPEADIYFTSTLNGNKTDKYDSYLEEIERLSKDGLKEASFNNKTIKLNLNEKYSFDREDFMPNSNAHLSIMGNMIKIDTSKKFSSKYEFRKISNNANELYLANNSQKTFKSNSIYSHVQTLNIEVTGGNINTKFSKDLKYYSNCSSSTKNIYGLYRETGELLEKINADNLTFISKDLGYGKYYIKQISHACNIKEDNTKYEVEINDNNEYPIANITLEEASKEIIINKSYGEFDNYKPEENAKFILSDDNTSLELITDVNGQAKITVGIGKYKLSQVSGLKNYTLVEDRTIDLSKIREDTLILDLKNKAIRKNIKVNLKDDLGNTLSNTKVCLYNSSREEVACKISNSKGDIIFKNMLLGDYTVISSNKEGYKIESNSFNVTLEDNDLTLVINYIKNKELDTKEDNKSSKEEIDIKEPEEDTKNNEKEIYVPDTMSFDLQYLIYPVISILFIIIKHDI